MQARAPSRSPFKKFGQLFGQAQAKTMQRLRARWDSFPHTLYLYIAREFAFSFFVAFLLCFVGFFINNILLIAGDLFKHHIPPGKIFLLLFFTIPQVLSLSFPFASLIGGLMAIGRLAGDNEILVMQSCGISIIRIFSPFMVLGILLTLSAVLINEMIVPYSSIQTSKIYHQLLVSAPSVELKPHTSRRYNDTVIVTGDIKNNIVYDVVIFDMSKNGDKRLISARQAAINSNEKDSDGVYLELQDVMMQALKPDDNKRLDIATSDKMVYRIDLTDESSSTTIGPSMMSSRDLAKQIQDESKKFTQKYNEYLRNYNRARTSLEELTYENMQYRGSNWQVVRDGLQSAYIKLSVIETNKPQNYVIDGLRLELHKKFSIPFGAFAFVFLAFPLGIRARRRGRSLGFMLGLIISVLYWSTLLFAQTLGSRLHFLPVFSMWLPNILIIAVASVLWIRERITE